MPWNETIWFFSPVRRVRRSRVWFAWRNERSTNRSAPSRSVKKNSSRHSKRKFLGFSRERSLQFETFPTCKNETSSPSPVFFAVTSLPFFLLTHSRDSFSSGRFERRWTTEVSDRQESLSQCLRWRWSENEFRLIFIHSLPFRSSIKERRVSSSDGNVTIRRLSPLIGSVQRSTRHRILDVSHLDLRSILVDLRRGFSLQLAHSRETAIRLQWTAFFPLRFQRSERESPARGRTFPFIVAGQMKLFVECDHLPEDFPRHCSMVSRTFLLDLPPFQSRLVLIRSTLRNLELRLHLQDATWDSLRVGLFLTGWDLFRLSPMEEFVRETIEPLIDYFHRERIAVGNANQFTDSFLKILSAFIEQHLIDIQHDNVHALKAIFVYAFLWAYVHPVEPK